MRLKDFFPRGIYGRAALILIVPIVTIQLVVSIAFIQRYFEGVTQQLSASVISEIQFIQADLERASDPKAAVQKARRTSRRFGVEMRDASAVPAQDYWGWDDLTGRGVVAELRGGLDGVAAVELTSALSPVHMFLETRYGTFDFIIPRGRLSPPNPHQLLVIIVLASALMTGIGYVFLRNQLRPIAALSKAAAAFGRGENVSFRPRGALEVRAAGLAFLDMRTQLETTTRTRTLMLSGISHDLRTPLTRLRLGLSMLPEGDDVGALLADVHEMERLINEFLAFAREDALEEEKPTDLAQLAETLAHKMARGGVNLSLVLPSPPIAPVLIRPQAVSRALENLVSNAQRYGKNLRLSLTHDADYVCYTVEDDGPGIPPEQRSIAAAPFVRLDEARSRGVGDGVGLGLSIVSDVARRHAGSLTLSSSAELGGLRADLRLRALYKAPSRIASG